MVLKRKLPTKNDAEANANKDAAASTPAEKPEVKEEAEQRPSRYADKAKEDAAEASFSAEPVAPAEKSAPQAEAPAPEAPKEKPKATPLKRSMPKKSESADKPKKQEKPKAEKKAAEKKPEQKKAEPKQEKPETPQTAAPAPTAPVKAPPPSDFKVPDIAPLGVPPESESAPAPMVSPSDEMASPSDNKESAMPWMEQKATPMEAPKEPAIEEKPPIPDNVETPTTPAGGSWLTDDVTPPSLGGGEVPEKPESAANPFSVEPITPPSMTPPPIFGEGEVEEKPAEPKKEDKSFSFGGAGQPPWKLNDAGTSKGDDNNPPVLPDAFQVAKDVGKKGLIGKVVTVVIALVVIVFAVKMYNQRDKATEMLARWTGTLKQVSEEVPETAEDKTALVQPENIVQPGQNEEIVQSDDVESEIFDELPDLEEFSVGDTQIEVLDVPLDEAGQPIVAGDDDEMPEDLSLFANIQRAISDAQTEKSVEEAKEKGFDVEAGKAEPTEEEIYLRNREMTLELQQQLAEYRKALAGESDPLKKPKPSEFFENASEGGTEQAVLQPPKQETARFGANPYDLPVVPEPSGEEEVPTVRTLADFEATMYEKQETRIRMPRGIRPKLENSDMVALEILSFVPNRGIIAFHQGREGVLLIGESIEGWELVAVFEHYAEFSNGTRRQTVTMR